MKVFTLTLLMLSLMSCGDRGKDTSHTQHTDKFIKAAHYFAAAWPKTFWEEFEKSEVDKDLQQIKQDGFNTVILVVPWMGFETEFNNNKTTSNKKLYKRFEYLLKKIKNENLDYILRLGFPHSFAPNISTNITELCTQFYTTDKTQKQWQNYLVKIKKITNKYPQNLSGILVSWEDFWCPHFIFPSLDEIQRKKLAQSTGYAQWMIQKDLTLLKIILGQNQPRQDNITIPKKDQLAYFYYIEFIDKKFDELVLKTTKTIFPQTAMEIRIDKDPAIGANNEKIWVEHNLYFEEVNHRGTYWAPFWGANNQGEKITLEKALFTFEYFLNYVTDNGKSTNHVIEQFNFTDNTPYFPNNASLYEEEVDDFLIKSVPLLKKYSRGYGLWAYRDYADNALYNSSFELGLDGWKTEGHVSIHETEGQKQLILTKNSSISQNYNPYARHMLATSYKQLNLCIESLKTGHIDVYANNHLETTAILNKGSNCITLNAENFINAKQIEFKLAAQSELIIDEIKLYGFVQSLGVYDEFNRSGLYLKSIQKINGEL